MRNGAALAGALLLAGCGAQTQAPPPRSTPPSRTAAPPPTQPRVPSAALPRASIVMVPGLEIVLGQTATGLVSLFGKPRLDVHEGDARKLQWRGEACALDVYLY